MKSIRRFVAIVAMLTLAVSLTAGAEPTVFPDRDWEDATPESQGVDRAKLKEAVEVLRQTAGKEGVKRMIIIRNGRAIWRGPEADHVQGVWSVTKAFTSTAHGLLIEDGKCTLDTLAKDYDADLAKYYGNVTLRHFATMTSGLDGAGGSYDFDDQHRGDQNALVEPLQPFFAPGTKYMYWDEATQHYGYTLTQIAGESLHEYLKQRILDPIGITRLTWKPDKTGRVLNWTGGIEISAADLARFGLLFLNRGKWKGRQLIDAGWVDEATRVQVPASIPNALPTSTRKGSGVYGYHWWPNGGTPEGKRRWPDAPLSTYARSGYNNNDLFVIPAWNMVTVRLGLDEQEDPITTDEYNTFLRKLGEAIRDPVLDGERRVWHPLSIRFRGPRANETDSEPNPFLDYRLQVEFTGPTGQRYNVPGYFDGDGHGSGAGNVWSVRFTPDEAGQWSYQASFRTGNGVAVALNPAAGQPTAFDGAAGSFDVMPRDPQAPGFLKWGRLQYVASHYLKFASGPYWIRGGTDSPENFLAYAGFDRTPPSHRYAAHIADWRPGDPDWGDGKGRGIIGAVNYLASHGANSIYLLTHNIGGDGKDVWPWAGSPQPAGSPENDNLHYDIGKLRQWETVFAHAQRQGVFLHFVFNEAEKPNKRELDDGELAAERKLYYRELIARFGHHLALEWNLCEEYNLGFDLGPDRVRRFAEYVQALDPYDHPITVHSAGDPFDALKFTFGDPLFSLTSIQLGQNRIDSLTEQFRKATALAGRPLPVSMDEFTVDKGQEHGWLPVDDAERWRVEKLWPTYMSGGNIEFILGDLLETDSFKTPEREKLWSYVLNARRFLEPLPFWQMQPADELAKGAATVAVTQNRGRTTYSMGAQVFCKPGEVYAVYLPKAEDGVALDLSDAEGCFRQRWYNPRTGEFEGRAVELNGRAKVALGKPPRELGEDWAILFSVRK
jgi:CubicO group peptidase (beta-lactamase class C family)